MLKSKYYTSRRFYYCRNNYNSYKLNFKSISKEYFNFISHIIHPENIISLKLFGDDYTPGQIKSFIKNFQLNKLNRLKYLKLIKINENDLELILKYLINNRLNYLEIEYRQYFTILNQSTIIILQNILAFETLQENDEEDNRLFPNLNYLKLTVNGQCSLNCFKLLSKLVYLKNLEKLVLIICFRGNYLNVMLKNFLIFLKNLSYVNSIEIFNRWHRIFSLIDINYFCSMISSNIKHLDIDIFDIDHIEILIDKLENVSSFKFKFAFDKSLYIKQVLQLLINKISDSTYISDIHYLSIWISRQFNRTMSNKRIKLTN
ncbi:unnamed protein product [Rotaria sordida]|uniref:Uncharacterized protein n=1 Tax=Rotaria sordida TaxID=392033 RepID=A0A814VIM2_9BILA|nr:unnamed protein product [Rotaria sordida]